MNLLLSALQILLAMHTAAGALWKLSNSENTVPSLRSIPHGVWMLLIGIELLCAIGLVVPLFEKSRVRLAVISAAVIAGEMLLFSALHLSSGATSYGEIGYWLVVCTVCAVIGVGRLAPERATLAQ
ncbi:MAG: DoxX family protein [Gemmatimonadaceae bacterium]|nr:DoxX family protein [Gemmatimonadaceae bacterium]